MGVIIDRMELERIANSVLSREFLGNLPREGSETRDPVTGEKIPMQQFEPFEDGKPPVHSKFFPPITRPIQERAEWWRERGIIKHRDDHYPYYYALGYLLRPYLIAEIGIYFGDSLMGMAKGSRDRWIADGEFQMARCVTVNGFDNEQYQPGCVEWARQAFINDQILTNLMVADTQKMDSLPLHMIELFHVDGDHTYNSALHDLEMADRTMVPSPRGVIIVDDVGWALPVKDAMMDFCAKSDWELQHQMPTLKGMGILTRKS